MQHKIILKYLWTKHIMKIKYYLRGRRRWDPSESHHPLATLNSLSQSVIFVLGRFLRLPSAFSLRSILSQPLKLTYWMLLLSRTWTRPGLPCLCGLTDPFSRSSRMLPTWPKGSYGSEKSMPFIAEVPYFDPYDDDDDDGDDPYWKDANFHINSSNDQGGYQSLMITDMGLFLTGCALDFIIKKPGVENVDGDGWGVCWLTVSSAQ